VGIHVLSIPGQGLFVLNLTDEHLHLLQLLGKRYVWFYREKIHQNQDFADIEQVRIEKKLYTLP
jgi:hypothetical protein